VSDTVGGRVTPAGWWGNPSRIQLRYGGLGYAGVECAILSGPPCRHRANVVCFEKLFNRACICMCEQEQRSSRGFALLG
jgi:hypothetical protein